MLEVIARRRSSATSAAGILGLIGERWTYQLVREIYFGVHRFGELQRALGISPNVLTTRLTGLVTAGLLEKRRYHTDPDWFEYHLTDASHEIAPAILWVAQWAEENLSDSPELRTIIHTTCGKRAEPQLVCGQCDRPIRARDLEAETVPRSTHKSRKRLSSSASEAGQG